MIRPDDGAGGTAELTPEQCLEQALARIRSGELASMTKCIVVFLDDTPPLYNVAFNPSGLRRSEIVTLAEYMKAFMLAGLLPPPPK
jgi:hypothetical protein